MLLRGENLLINLKIITERCFPQRFVPPSGSISQSLISELNQTHPRTQRGRAWQTPDCRNSPHAPLSSGTNGKTQPELIRIEIPWELQHPAGVEVHRVWQMLLKSSLCRIPKAWSSLEAGKVAHHPCSPDLSAGRVAQTRTARRDPRWICWIISSQLLGLHSLLISFVN